MARGVNMPDPTYRALLRVYPPLSEDAEARHVA
jgi:hypothetical protein